MHQGSIPGLGQGKNMSKVFPKLPPTQRLEVIAVLEWNPANFLGLRRALTSAGRPLGTCAAGRSRQQHWSSVHNVDGFWIRSGACQDKGTDLLGIKCWT